MREKKLIFIFVIGIVLAMLIFIYLVFLRFSTTEPTVVPSPTPVNISKPIVIPFNKPKTSTLVVDRVTTQNFYDKGTIIDTNGDVSIKKNRLYELVYLAPFQEFIIDVLGSPFSTARLQAEQAFLKELGIAEEEACKLKVSVGTTYRVNPEEAGMKFGLSFCEN